MMRAIIRTAVVFAVAASSLLPVPVRAVQDKDTAYTDQLKQAQELLAKRQWADALTAYKRASALHDKTSAVAHAGMARAFYGMGDYTSAVDSWTEALKYTNGDPKAEAACRNQRGMALYAQTAKADKKVKDAEADFRAAVALDSTLGIARYNLGVALMRQSRDEEGSAELKTFVESFPTAPEILEARRFLNNPRRAREPVSNAFTIVTLDGETISMEDLRGRVVLLDFWATWCGPCKAALPGLRLLNKKYADRPFTLISVSMDNHEAEARDYVAKNQMTWRQYVDTGGALSGIFSVQPLPTYVLLDMQGRVVQRHEGWLATVEADLTRQIDGLLKKAATTAPR